MLYPATDKHLLFATGTGRTENPWLLGDSSRNHVLSLPGGQETIAEWWRTDRVSNRNRARPPQRRKTAFIQTRKNPTLEEYREEVGRQEEARQTCIADEQGSYR